MGCGERCGVAIAAEDGKEMPESINIAIKRTIECSPPNEDVLIPGEVVAGDVDDAGKDGA